MRRVDVGVCSEKVKVSLPGSVEVGIRNEVTTSARFDWGRPHSGVSSRSTKVDSLIGDRELVMSFCKSTLAGRYSYMTLPSGAK